MAHLNGSHGYPQVFMRHGRNDDCHFTRAFKPQHILLLQKKDEQQDCVMYFPLHLTRLFGTIFSICMYLVQLNHKFGSFIVKLEGLFFKQMAFSIGMKSF